MNETREGEYPDVIKWEKVNDKVWDKVLWSDEKTGSYVRLVRGDPGFEGKETLKHEFDELVYVLQGMQINLKTGLLHQMKVSHVLSLDTTQRIRMDFAGEP